MPIFTPDPDVARAKLGRPWALWFTTAWWESWTLVYRNGQWEFLESPLEEDLVGCSLIFQQRENFVTYQEVRDYTLTNLGRVIYRDDYDDMWSGEFISKENTPFHQAVAPEPIHSDTGVIP
jgi:hypothetical protein